MIGPMCVHNALHRFDYLGKPQPACPECLDRNVVSGTEHRRVGQTGLAGLPGQVERRKAIRIRLLEMKSADVSEGQAATSAGACSG